MDHEGLVRNLMKPVVLKVMTKVKQLYDPMLESHNNISIKRHQTRFFFLLLVVLAGLRIQIDVGNLGGTKRLQLVNDHVEPNEFHFDFWVVGGLPNDHLAALVQRQKY